MAYHDRLKCQPILVVVATKLSRTDLSLALCFAYVLVYSTGYLNLLNVIRVLSSSLLLLKAQFKTGTSAKMQTHLIDKRSYYMRTAK